MSWLVPLWLALSCGLLAGQPLPKAALKVAFAYYGTASDLGWTWRHNQGRIFMHTRLLERYPGLALQSLYQENVPESTPDCLSVFEGWAQQGVDLIVGTSYGHQFCMAPLAPKYPKTMWFAVSAVTDPNVSNWGAGYARLYQPIYLAGILAGHASRTGRIGCVLPFKIPETQRQLAAFALGVAHVNASYEVHVGWTNNWQSPRHEILGTRALAQVHADVVYYRADNILGLKEALRYQMYIIGFNADYRMQIGESVLASPYFVWGVIYLQVAEMVLLGTFEAATPMNLFPGLREGTVAMSDLSFLVSKASMEDMDTARQAILNGSDPFCGPIRTNNGTIEGAPGHCSNFTELTTMNWQPYNVIDHGPWLLPSQTCDPGEYATWNKTTWKWLCRPCPAGTFSRVLTTEANESIVCVPCAAGSVAAAKAARCTDCGPGTAPSATNASCEECPPDTYSVDGSKCTLCPGSLQSLPGADHCFERPQTETNVVAIAAVVGACTAVSLAVVAWVFVQRHLETAKLLLNAPRGEVAVMFTDVQSSTTLWDNYPEAIAWALDQHNCILRRLFAEFDGYEVKTIGDAFMVVFQHPCQALRCAVRIQEDLLQQHWPLELQQEESCCTQKDGYDRLIWNGPRVRTGVHFGTPQVEVDRERGRVDYFGPAVNIAALAESKAAGGQTLVTKDLHRQIPPEVWAATRLHVASIGAHRFPVEARVLEVYSVLPDSLSTRTFPERKENICHRCDCNTMCPRCDAVMEHGQPVRQRHAARVAPSPRSALLFFPGLRPSSEDLL